MRIKAYPTVAAYINNAYADLLTEYGDCLDEETYDVLHKRLVEGKSEQEIALAYNYSREAINRKARKGLEKIEARMRNKNRG